METIGAPQSKCSVDIGGKHEERTIVAPDHAVAVRLCLEQLSDPRHSCLASPAELSAIAFKAVHAQGMTGVQRVDESVLAAMEAYADVAPAHNPPYTAVMRLLMRELPWMPLVAAFETWFHQSIAPAEYLYAVPLEWTKLGIRKWGFHGASHRFIAERTGELLNNPEAKIVSCHLGGSSSICAIDEGCSVATSMGMTPQSGLPQNNRVGDFDVFALPAVMRATGKTLDQVLDDLANRSGLFGLSGCNDLREIEAEASKGGPVSQQALDVFVAAVRHYIGAYLVLLDGADAIVFTGGIGENSARIREAVCRHLDWFGIILDPHANENATGEAPIHATLSRTQIWIMPTHEEFIVAPGT